MSPPRTTYDPPVNDPREEGIKHWDKMREELMTTRDELSASEAESAQQKMMIESLIKDNDRLTTLREQDQAECIALRTSLQNLGHMILTILKIGMQARKGPGAYAPPNDLQKTLAGQVDEIEAVLQGKPPKFLTQEVGDQHTTQ